MRSPTARQTEAIILAGLDGMTSWEISIKMRISINTVIQYLNRGYERLGAKGREDVIDRLLDLQYDNTGHF